MLTKPFIRTFTSSLLHRPAPTEYRSVPEGKGATLRFSNNPRETIRAHPQDKEHIHHVGTHGIRTCVGVYFALDASRCFLAHINADTLRNGTKSDLDRALHSEAEEDFFREAVKARLAAHALAQGWNIDCKSRILRSLLLICPESFNPHFHHVPEKHFPKKQTGFSVAQGIKEFLGVPAETPVRPAEGFVVKHPDGRPVLRAGVEEQSEGCDDARRTTTALPA